MVKKNLRLIIVTTTRADWGILSPLARTLSMQPDVEVIIAAGNMHTSEKYGSTADEILSDGFSDVCFIDTPETDSTGLSRTLVASAMATGLGRIIEKKHPDGVVLLGDRYEILGAAMASVIAGVPVVHLHGGEITEGAIDDSIRHAVSKLASLHLTATACAADILSKMGEDPDRIVHTGAIGVENALSVPIMSREKLSESLGGFDVNPDKTLLVTFHPVTRHPDHITTRQQVSNLLMALDRVPECNVIITYPNNDKDGEEIIDMLSTYAKSQFGRVVLVKSMGKLKYLSALRYVKAVVGNSSSGILEAPSTPAATIDIGPRQMGRERAESVIHVNDDAEQIVRAIKTVLVSPREKRSPEMNPYFKAEAVKTAMNAIIEKLPRLSPVKKLHISEK